MRNFFQRGPAQQFTQTIARIAFAISRNGGVYGDHQRRKSGHTRPFKGSFGSASSANQIKLIPHIAGRSRSNPFQLVPGDGGKCERYSGAASRGCCRKFPVGMHEPAVADGSQYRWKGNLVTKDFRSQVALFDGNGVPGPENNFVENARVSSQCDFIRGSAFQIVEHHSRKPAARQDSQIFNIHHFS
jgi:hypothetical protein